MRATAKELKQHLRAHAIPRAEHMSRQVADAWEYVARMRINVEMAEEYEAQEERNADTQTGEEIE